MRRLPWIAAALGLVVWSLLAWGVYGLIQAAGALIATHSDWASAHPETVEWIAWLAAIATQLGLAGVVAAWLFGAVAIVVVCAALAWSLRHCWPYLSFRRR